MNECPRSKCIWNDNGECLIHEEAEVTFNKKCKLFSKGEKISLKQRLNEKLEAVYDQRTAVVRARHIERWNELCGGEYTLEHPVVHLEWELCDLNNQKLLMKGKREEFFERANLNDIEKEIYLTGKDNAGDPYTYIEGLKLRKETGKAIKMVIKGRL